MILRPHVLKAIEYLGARYVETCDMSALASWVGISPSPLAHVFRDAMQGRKRSEVASDGVAQETERAGDGRSPLIWVR
jgi:hypothetical protein